MTRLVAALLFSAALGGTALAAGQPQAPPSGDYYKSQAEYVTKCGPKVAVSQMSNDCVLVLWQQNWLFSFQGSRCQARNDLVNVDGVRKVIAWLSTHPNQATADDKSGGGAALKALAPCP